MKKDIGIKLGMAIVFANRRDYCQKYDPQNYEEYLICEGLIE